MDLLDESAIREQARRDGITHVSTGVAISRNNKILLVRRAAADYLGGQYELPGGGVDEGENISDAAIREVKEETGLNVTSVLAVFDGFDYKTDRKPYVRQINFLVEVEAGDIVLNPDEHDEFQWADSDTDLNSLMSFNMQTCVAEAFRIVSQLHLYLFTLEVDPLEVGSVYNPLPSHLTLASRFWSEHVPDVIVNAVDSVFRQSEPIEVIIDGEAVIGPKKTAVHLAKNTDDLKSLHSKLLKELNELNVTYTAPQFVGDGHRPHVSKREGADFSAGHMQMSRATYLIEVAMHDGEHLRRIRHMFMIGA